MLVDTARLYALADHLSAQAGTIAQLRAVAGFDGFLDEIIRVVAQRHSVDHYQAVPTISAFSDLLGAAAGRSSLREIVIERVDAGGCAVNLGHGLAALGPQVSLWATLGEPVHPAFSEACAQFAQVQSLAPFYGRTLACEFSDGKYMLSAVADLARFDAAYLALQLRDGRFLADCAGSNLIALTNWTLYPHMSACWTLLQQQVLAKLPQRPWVLLDLVDPRGRSRADLEALLGVIRAFAPVSRCVFAGNVNEGNVLAELVGLPQANDQGDQLASQAAGIREHLGLEGVVLHGLQYAACADRVSTAQTPGPYTPKPRKSTGAGDRFNAGFALGLMLNLPLQQRLHLACAASGYFVRHGQSASLPELCIFLRSWAQGELAD